MDTDKNDLKVGAIICAKPLPETNLLEYEAIVFIKNVPHDFNDEQLKNAMKALTLQLDTKDCKSIIYRADISATSNEVWEQFKELNNDKGKAQVIYFDELNV